MKFVALPLLSLLVLAACAEGGGNRRCFPVQADDLAIQSDVIRGTTLVCGLNRVRPGAREKYIERYPDLAPGYQAP